jgi:hypothetical protein
MFAMAARVVALGAMVMVAAAEADAAEVSRLTFRGATASGFFQSVDSSGCLVTQAFVSGSDDVIRQGSETVLEGPLAQVQVIRFDACNFDLCGPRVVTELSAFSFLPEGALTISKDLGSARLNTTLLALDFVTGASVPLVVDMVFTATGPRSLQEQLFIDAFPGPEARSGLRSVGTFVGTVRKGTASGSVSDGSTNYTPNAAEGSIGTARSGLVQISR